MKEKWIDVHDKSAKEICDILNNHKENGIDVYCRVNERIIHSNNFVEDDVYIAKYGFTKSELEERSNDSLHNEQLEQMQTDIKTPIWIDEGKKMIYPEKFNSWETCVGKMADSRLRGKPIEMALSIMKVLDSGESLRVASYLLNSDDKIVNNLVEKIVLNYSKRGPEFMEYIRGMDLNDSEKKIIESVKAKNAEIEENAKQNDYMSAMQ